MKIRILLIFVLCMFASSALAADSSGRYSSKKKSANRVEETCETRCTSAQKTCLSKCHSKDSKVNCDNLCEQNTKRCVERCPQ